MNNSRPMDQLLMALPRVHPKMDLLLPLMVLLLRSPLQVIKARHLLSQQYPNRVTRQLKQGAPLILVTHKELSQDMGRHQPHSLLMVEPKPLLQVVMPNPHMASLLQDMGNLLNTVRSHQLGQVMEVHHLLVTHLGHPNQAMVSRCLTEIHHLQHQGKLEDMGSHRNNHMVVTCLLVVILSLLLVVIPSLQLILARTMQQLAVILSLLLMLPLTLLPLV